MKFAALIGAAVASLLWVAPARAADPYQFQVILPLTGGFAFTGNGEQKALGALTDLVNRDGGINGRPVALSVHDDQSNPQVAVQLANEVMAGHPPVFLGSTVTGMCNAEAPLVKAGPVMYCFSPGFHPAAGSYAYSATIATHDLVEALIRYFRLRGWTRLAMIISTDATGQDIETGINDALAMPENAGVTMVQRERFNPNDLSVGAQIEQIMQAKPQALIAWTTGAPIATIFKAIVQSGLDIPVGTTNGNSSIPQLESYAGFLPRQLFIPTGPYFEHDGIARLDPRVEQAQQEMYAALKARGIALDNQAAIAWDATKLVIDALRKLGTDTTADKVRAYINGLTDYPGVWGLYDFTKIPQRGLDSRWTVVTSWLPAEKRFVWVSQPGGIPLGR